MDVLQSGWGVMSGFSYLLWIHLDCPVSYGVWRGLSTDNPDAHDSMP